MYNPQRGNKFGGGRNFSKPRSSSERPDMHKATCSTCGKICEVPFRPTGSKPVYCRDCFASNGGAARAGVNAQSARLSATDRQMYSAICASCGNKCQIPFQPNPGREVFCSRCFERNETAGSIRSGGKPAESTDYKADFEALNTKLDKILHLLNPAPIEVASSETLKDKIEEEKIEI